MKLCRTLEILSSKALFSLVLAQWVEGSFSLQIIEQQKGDSEKKGKPELSF